MTRSRPEASSTVAASAVARANPPSDPRVAMLRMKSPDRCSDPACGCGRPKSLRRVRLVGSTAMMPTSASLCDSAWPADRPAALARAGWAGQADDSRLARIRKSALSSSDQPSARFSTVEIARASARGRRSGGGRSMDWSLVSNCQCKARRGKPEMVLPLKPSSATDCF